jgi:hypothetical protein
VFPSRALLCSLTVLAGLGLPAAAQDAEVFLLRGEDSEGRALESRVTLSTKTDGTLWLERVATGASPAQQGAGRAERSEDCVRVTLTEQRGLAGRLEGVAPSPPAVATYRFRGSRVQAVVRVGDQIVSREEGRKLPSPAPVSSYTLADPEAGSGEIDVAAINADASALLRSLSDEERSIRSPLIVVPGYASEDQGLELRLHPKSQKRAERAAKLLQTKGAHVILCSGANVHPKNTPFNEAVELRRYLVDELGVPAWRVAIDPYARHTTTNMRNAGRFMLTHQIPKALIVSTRAQSFYVSVPRLSSFHRRCRATLGYEVGRFRVGSHWTTHFEPSPDVLTRGSDPLDP